MLKASIDIGSNSVLLLIAEIEEGQLQERHGQSQVTGLGRGMGRSGAGAEVLCNEAMLETMEVLREYCATAKKFQIAPADILVTATEASRVAKNAKEFYEKVQKEFGLKVHIITAQAEAYFSALGVMLGETVAGSSLTSMPVQLIQAQELMILDVGGASTEIIKVNCVPFKVQSSISFPMGSVRCTEWQEQNQFNKNFQHLLQEWQWPLPEYKTLEMVCIAGTMTAIAAIDLKLTGYADDLVHHHCIPSGQFRQLLDYLSQVSQVELLQDYPFLGKRAQNLQAGALLAYCLGESLGVEFYKISVFGLRHGVLFEGKIRSEYLFCK